MAAVIAMPRSQGEDAHCQWNAQKVVMNAVFVSVVNVNAKWVSVEKRVSLQTSQKDAQKIAPCMVIAV